MRPGGSRHERCDRRGSVLQPSGTDKAKRRSGVKEPRLLELKYAVTCPGLAREEREAGEQTRQLPKSKPDTGNGVRLRAWAESRVVWCFMTERAAAVAAATAACRAQ